MTQACTNPRGVTNSKDGDGMTPLLWALIGDEPKMDIAWALLSARADVRCADPLGRTPLSHAAGHGADMLIRELIKHNAVVNDSDAHGAPPLSHAIDQSRAKTAMMLLNEFSAYAPEDADLQLFLRQKLCRGQVDMARDRGLDEVAERIEVAQASQRALRATLAARTTGSYSSTASVPHAKAPPAAVPDAARPAVAPSPPAAPAHAAASLGGARPAVAPSPTVAAHSTRSVTRSMANAQSSVIQAAGKRTRAPEAEPGEAAAPDVPDAPASARRRLRGKTSV
eukprot:TRINITY_DN23045_c0_g1_i2.p1 TRINITY_DN23045_c0_g1~~TRINITY_DN23045_c0_g1_i2.p1  ORF type:complete len:282 (+),score=28.94 TRINITY_DN23045_c0_g1_i2:95-940(+)